MRPFYRLCYCVVGIQLWFHRIKIEGREHVPAGGCLMVANHASFIDPTTVGWAVGREIFYLARKTLFKPPFLNWFLVWCNVMPIDRDGRDMSGLRNIIKKLKNGDAILLFPEGTRSPDGKLQEASPGAGFMAVKSGVPILPVRIFGSFEVLCRHTRWYRFYPLRVVIGKPYLPEIPPGMGSKEAFASVAEEMMARIAALK